MDNEQKAILDKLRCVNEEVGRQYTNPDVVAPGFSSRMEGFDVSKCPGLREAITEEIDAEILEAMRKVEANPLILCTCSSTKKGIYKRSPTPVGGRQILSSFICPDCKKHRKLMEVEYGSSTMVKTSGTD